MTAGDTSAPHWCVCGMPTDDPRHWPWHRILEWNRAIFAAVADRRAADFDQDLEVHDRRTGRDAPPQQGLDLGPDDGRPFRPNG